MLVRLRAERRPDLPPLAWLLDLTGDEAMLVAGDSVEVRDDRFFEGAWAGLFAQAAIDEGRDIFGSGGLRTPSGWLLVPPSHTLEYLVCLRGPRGWVASNSLAFLHAWTNARFELPSRRLTSIFVGIISGIHQSPISVETTAGTLLALFHHNCLLRLDGPGFDLRPKPLPPPFPDYTSYVEHVRQTISLVAANAAAPERRRGYRILATCSSGYDSPACAALARTSGCDEAITFDVARSGAPDEGSRIAERLGLRVSRIVRPLHTHDLGDAELEFLSTGMHAEDVVFAAASRHLAGRVVLTGFHAGTVWDLRSHAIDGLSSTDVAGSSMGEFRLQRDFVHVPVPFIGAQRVKDILAIGRSAELEAFTLQHWYNKPIARRIVEEAGVPRELFGQSKEAISMLVFVDEEQLSPATRRAVQERVAAFGVRDRLAYRLQRLWFRVGLRCYELAETLSRWLPGQARPFYGRMSARLLGRIFRPSFALFEHTNPFMGVAFEYALSEISKRYRGPVVNAPG
jgi:hypothetical protein